MRVEFLRVTWVRSGKMGNAEKDGGRERNLEKRFQGFTRRGASFLVRVPSFRNAQVVELVDTHA